MAKRNRISIGRLVASTDNLKNIMGKRLEVEIRYIKTGFNYKIIYQDVIGIRTNPFY